MQPLHTSAYHSYINSTFLLEAYRESVKFLLHRQNPVIIKKFCFVSWDDGAAGAGGGVLGST